MPRDFTATVVSNERLGGGNVHMTFAVPPAILADPAAGQFVMVRCATSHDPLLRRPFSPAGWDAQAGTLSLLILRIGRATRWLTDRRPGDQVEMLGLLGSGFSVAPTSRRLLLVAGGVGIAPLLALAQQALAHGLAVTVLAGGASASALLPATHLPTEAEYVLATVDGSAGHQGLVTDLVPNYLDWADQLFACGPNPMFVSLARLLRQRGPADLQPPLQVAIEEYMACGLGVCVGCVTETRRHGMQRVCKEGPVFDWKDLAWL